MALYLKKLADIGVEVEVDFDYRDYLPKETTNVATD